MTIQEELVNSISAQLLKKTGFNIPTTNYFKEVNGEYSEHQDEADNWNVDGDSYSRPTQSLAMRWLRDEHKIFTQIEVYSPSGKPEDAFFTYTVYHDKYDDGDTEDEITYTTFEESSEECLKTALDILITYNDKVERGEPVGLGSSATEVAV